MTGTDDRRREPPAVLIAIGANLPGPLGSALDTCRLAVRTLAASPLLRLRAVSAWYETAPEGEGASGPAYVNGVARFEPTVALLGSADGAATLLATLAAIEAASGRTRTSANAPRTLDLDIVAMGGLIRRAPDPVLPHPRAQFRRFVLLPLRDVAPDWVHPVLGLAADALLARLPPGEIRRLAEGDAGR